MCFGVFERAERPLETKSRRKVENILANTGKEPSMIIIERIGSNFLEVADVKKGN